MSVRCFLIDAFATEVFTGNAAGVVVLGDMAPVSWMQGVAAELQQAETGFVAPGSEEGVWALRWFTPTTEIALCGHATLAATWALRELTLCREGEQIRFATASGELRGRALATGAEIELPRRPIEAGPVPDDVIGRALAGCRYAPVGAIGGTERDWLVRLDSAADVAAVTVDISALGGLGRSGLVITAPGTDEDFVSRYFAPGLGIPEDSVTGSTHCALGPYWAEELGKRELVARQLSARGGAVRVVVHEECVVLAGSAVTVLKGELIPPFGA